RFPDGAHRRHHGSELPFRIGRSAPVEHAVPQLGCEWRMLPERRIADTYDIGMSRQAHRLAVAASFEPADHVHPAHLAFERLDLEADIRELGANPGRDLAIISRGIDARLTDQALRIVEDRLLLDAVENVIDMAVRGIARDRLRHLLISIEQSLKGC